MKANIILYFCLSVASGFEIYWNAPTTQCKKYGLDFVSILEIYGIQINREDKFQGDRMTIFYENQLGLYPRIVKEEMENGGIPQKGDITKHLEKAAEDIENVIPWKDFTGLGVIDWEAWRPTWDFNWGCLRIYQNKSIELAEELFPTSNKSTISTIAKNQWEKSAKLYMLETLQLAKKLRPKAPWGYYLFPDCYNYKGEKPKDFQCAEKIRKGNDKLSFLWEESTALYPSIYVKESYLDTYTFKQRSWRDNEKLRETRRVASRKAKIFPYVNYFDKKLIPEEDMWRILAQAAAGGSDGAVIWGSSASVGSQKLCNNLKKYITETLGPAAEKVAWKSNLCSKEICNSRGQCTFPNDNFAVAWKLFIDDTSTSFHAGDITCRCSENYSGRFCENST
nr:venom protein [Lampona murina]